MPKRILTVIILLVAIVVFGPPVYCPFNYVDKVARAQSGPDLTIEAITSSPETPAIGDDVTFTVTIRNQGTSTSGRCYVAYYIDDDYLTNDYVQPIDPGAITEHTFTWTAEVGIHAITAVADYREQVNESDESNNQKTYTLSTLGADLVIDSITWSPSAPTVGSTVIFTITIRNRGAVVANSNHVYFYIDGTSRDHKDVARINPRETLTTTFSWFAKAGPHDIKAIVDKNDLVPETDEDNNEMTVLFSALLPDLIIDDISWSPTEPSMGDNVSFTVQVANQGNGVAANSTVHFYVNENYLDSEQTSELDPGAAENVTFSWIAGFVPRSIKAVVSLGGIFTESDKTNNEKAYILSPKLSDLIIQDIAWTPSNPSVGENVTFTVTVKNQGSGNSIESTVDFFIDNEKVGYRRLVPIDANNAKTVSFNWIAKGGVHKIQAIVDPHLKVPESKETNNYKAITFPPLPPDLIIEQITWTPSEPAIGDTVTFTVTVKNQGEAISGYAYIIYYIDNIQLTSGRVNPVSNNATDNQTFTWTVTAGEHVIKAFVDSTDIVEESDETNNERVTTFIPFAPDLIIESIDWSHNDPLVGETVTFTLTVKNNGGVKAATSLVHLYIDNNPRGYQDIPELEPGTRVTRTFSWTVAAGPHFIRAVVDDSNLVTESNETNNETLIGYPMPDLTLDAVTWSPIEPSMGDKVTVTAYVKNKGSRRAEGFQLYFYVDDEVVNQQEIPPLDAGARVIKTFEWNVAAGPQVITVFADGSDTVTEGAEDNNVETVAFSVPAPDLIIESITWASEELSASDNVVFTVTIRNQGDASAGYASVNYYVDGQYLSSGQVNPIEPDADTEETFRTWISQAGPHTIKVVIDEGNQVLESNEVNNEKTVTFSIENITPPSEQVPAPSTQPQQRPASPAPIPLTPSEKDHKMVIMFGIVVLVFGVTLILSLLREFRRRS